MKQKLFLFKVSAIFNLNTKNKVPLSIESLNHSDVFILDNKEQVFQWNPENSSRMEILRASVFAKRIRDDDNCGKGQLIVIGIDNR